MGNDEKVICECSNPDCDFQVERTEVCQGRCPKCSWILQRQDLDETVIWGHNLESWFGLEVD